MLALFDSSNVFSLAIVFVEFVMLVIDSSNVLAYSLMSYV
nr:MAG TPA: hypothetical protein [Caudoviricetes sp.]